MRVPVRGLSSGIVIRVHLCWNFGPLVSETLLFCRDELKTPGCDVLVAHLGHKTLTNMLVFEAVQDGFDGHPGGSQIH